ncbi:hypothetical protein CVT24_002593 [Panaeolus cyanescens]|uniref:Uncharacterized protein n=1 Tax=Panaeolus cyanescens TaxID=181874 RepID=A0A409WPU1_9AGAR|nr:hypothetical protein CVT24_002593 [Panaeolus cyanescens]
MSSPLPVLSKMPTKGPFFNLCEELNVLNSFKQCKEIHHHIQNLTFEHFQGNTLFSSQKTKVLDVYKLLFPLMPERFQQKDLKTTFLFHLHGIIHNVHRNHIRPRWTKLHAPSDIDFNEEEDDDEFVPEVYTDDESDESDTDDRNVASSVATRGHNKALAQSSSTSSTSRTSTQHLAGALPQRPISFPAVRRSAQHASRPMDKGILQTGGSKRTKSPTIRRHGQHLAETAGLLMDDRTSVELHIFDFLFNEGYTCAHRIALFYGLSTEGRTTEVNRLIACSTGNVAGVEILAALDKLQEFYGSTR